MKKSKKLVVSMRIVMALALSVLIIGCANLKAYASTISIRRPNTSTDYVTTVQLKYSRSEFKKLKGKSGKMLVSFTDGTKAEVKIKYYSNKVKVNVVKNPTYTNIWTVNCNGSKTLSGKSLGTINVSVGTKGDVTLNFTFKLPRDPNMT